MTAVPALKRGIKVLELLNQLGDLTLDQLAGATNYPKASLLRMLETLSELGLIRRLSADKQYQALCTILPKHQHFEIFLEESLQQLAVDTEACVEWYSVAEEGMRIVQRYNPPHNEVQVFARVGFLRPWYQELEAVSVTALAWAQTLPAKPRNAKQWQYDVDGDITLKSAQEIKGIISSAREEAFYQDPFFNTNGVKRIAAPVIRHEKLFGVIALAINFRPQLNKIIHEKCAVLKNTAQMLSRSR